MKSQIFCISLLYTKKTNIYSCYTSPPKRPSSKYSTSPALLDSSGAVISTKSVCRSLQRGSGFPSTSRDSPTKHWAFPVVEVVLGGCVFSGSKSFKKKQKNVVKQWKTPTKIQHSYPRSSQLSACQTRSL